MRGDTELAAEAVQRVLGSLYPDGNQLLVSFLYGEPGAPQWQRRLGAEIFVHHDQYIDALLFIREHGAPFLGDIAGASVTEQRWSVGSGGVPQFAISFVSYIAFISFTD